ncbi:dUTP diphosphatase [Candidatus Woesearchaeota archaeon]|nr:dUTP diphosphatase [Candidatus Woesearchaeota archaeon]
MALLKIKKIHDRAILPRYAHEGDAGLDLCSVENAALPPGEKKLIPTGISIQIPEGHVGLIWDRSGFAAMHGLHTLAGVVDSGYRGEIKVVLINLGKETMQIQEGMRIAQLLIQPIVSVEVAETDQLDPTKRGEGGFGSTGRH